MSTRFGPNFGKVFAAALLQEMSFFLLVHFPGYLKTLGITESLIGILYAAAAVVSLVFRPALGPNPRSDPPRTVLLVTGLLNAAVCSLWRSPPFGDPLLWGLFLAQRVLQIALFTTMLTYGADSIPAEHRTQGLALFGLSRSLPRSVGWGRRRPGHRCLWLPGALRPRLSRESHLMAPGVASAPTADPSSPSSTWLLGAAFAQRNLLPLWWVTLMFSIGMETVFTFTRTYVGDRAIGSTGLFFGVYGVSAAAMRIAGGRRYDRVPQRPFVAGSLLAYGSGLVLMAMRGRTPRSS